jgi:hypothetical protein
MGAIDVEQLWPWGMNPNSCVSLVGGLWNLGLLTLFFEVQPKKNVFKHPKYV